MQTQKNYSGDRTLVKPTGTATGQRIECRITTRRGESLAGSTLHLRGTLAEVLGWMQTRCCQCGSHPGGKMIELSEVTQ